MMEKPKKKECPPAWKYAENMYLKMPAASAAEFTGLAPVVPETETEAEGLCDTMSVPVTAKDGGEAYRDMMYKENDHS